MSLDREANAIRRSLAAQGIDPREVAAALLQVPVSRFWMVVLPEAAGQEWAPKTPTPFRVTGYTRVSSGVVPPEVSRQGIGVYMDGVHLLAYPVLTLAEWVETAKPFLARGWFVRLWDSKAKAQVTMYGAATLDDVQEGWAEGLNRFGVSGINFQIPDDIETAARRIRARVVDLGCSTLEACRDLLRLEREHRAQDARFPLHA